MVFSVRLLCTSLPLLLLLISSSQRTRASSERCALGFNQHNVTALPRVICLIAGTRLQLIIRQVDIQMDKGGKDSGSEGRRKGGSEIGREITGKERTRVSWDEKRGGELLIKWTKCGRTSLILTETLVGFMPIKFSTVLHYLSAACQLVSCNPAERAEGSLPLGVWGSWLIGAGICGHTGYGAKPSGSSPRSWNTQLSVD